MIIYLNEKEFIINEKFINILQVCNIADIFIPRFCYHDKLTIAGNCRMCLVEVKGSIKPVASCALPIADNMHIFTDSKLVKKSREGILEFILINHPLDCPICDQGGECDLQDQSLLYGNDKGRFYDFKRSVKDKNCGPLIKTIMTRCIQCTRCVRFMREISGLNLLGVIGRGKSMEISNFLKKSFISELSGNVIDICPVGALTSKPYSFSARPWELSSICTIDLNDTLHANIRVDIRDTRILRILPNSNLSVNENWITDSTRFSYDGILSNRMNKPYIKYKANGAIVSTTWINALKCFNKIKFNKINFLLGDFIDMESALLIKKISNSFGNFSINLIKKTYLKNDFRSSFLFNKDYYINLNFEYIFLFNTNLRLENPILNLKLKKLVDKNLVKVITISSSFGYNFFTYNFNNSYREFKNFLEGKNALSSLLTKEGKSLLIFNCNFFHKDIEFDILDFIQTKLNFLKSKVFKSYMSVDTTSIIINEFNLLNSVNNFNDFSLKNANSSKNQNLFYLINTENFNLINKNFLRSDMALIAFQGLYNNFSNKFFKNYIDVFLPSAHFTEKNVNFINFYGLKQKTNFILYDCKDIRLDFDILYVFFKNYLNDRILKHFFDSYNSNNKEYNFVLLNMSKFFYKMFSFKNLLCFSFITNIYKSNLLLKRSLTMSKCYFELKNIYSNFI